MQISGKKMKGPSNEKRQHFCDFCLQLRLGPRKRALLGEKLKLPSFIENNHRQVNQKAVLHIHRPAIRSVVASRAGW